MLTATSVQAQVAAAREDPLRVLVVGAGVAGVTLAQLLRRAGLHPVLLERSGQDADSGYMLALMPMVDPVLEELGLRDEYAAHSVGLRRYRLRNRAGALIREYSMEGLLNRFGDYRGISRGELLQVLGSNGGTVSYGATVTAAEQRSGAARVIAYDGSEHVGAEFDVVVAADGLHSTTRDLVLHANQVSGYDTGWGGWVAWSEPDDASDLGEELWGAGFFIATYPVKGRLGVFVGGARVDTRVGPERFVARVRGELTSLDSRLDAALDAVARSNEAYYWSLTDCRCATWSVGRVVLLGDAAAGFLPTAGIGAGMAMESAWALGRRLGTATPERVLDVLRDYEQAQRPRVESALGNSRQLARLVFRRSKVLAALRDTAIRFVTLERALRPIRTLLKDTPRVPSREPTLGPGARGAVHRARAPRGL
jgi:2-polyprenyl-6-methoxyphenol hydroxylase-like FAD-dependent oxidoreductase